MLDTCEEGDGPVDAGQHSGTVRIRGRGRTTGVRERGADDGRDGTRVGGAAGDGGDSFGRRLAESVTGILEWLRGPF